jgi:hypothetical protein
VVRGLLREQRLPVPVGARTVLARVAAILEDADVELPGLLRHTVAQVVDEIRGLDHASPRSITNSTGSPPSIRWRNGSSKYLGWACSRRRRLSAR